MKKNDSSTSMTNTSIKKKGNKKKEKGKRNKEKWRVRNVQGLRDNVEIANE